VIAIALFFQHPDIQSLDQLAQRRDVAGLTAYLSSVPKHNPFSVLKTGGAYAAGRLGWHALPLTAQGGEKYVVFSTPLIEEDMGELLFKVDQSGKLTYVPESDDRGVAIDKHNFDIRFDLDNAKAIITDQIACHRDKPLFGLQSHFFFRISPTFTIRSIVDSHGAAVPYSQAGGIVSVQPRDPMSYTVKYDGTTLMPAFDRQISDREATLSGAVWYLTIARQPAPYDATIHCRPDWTAIAQGDLLSSSVSGNEKILKFHNALPVVWYGASAGPYKTVVDNVNGHEFATMSASMTEDQMHLQNRYDAEVVDFYSSHFMPYPFKRWTALDSWQFHGGPGALEAYSFATYPGGLPEQDSHEPSHTFWGGILNNNYLQSLWNESFAVYCQGLFSRHRAGGNEEELAKAFGAVGDANPFYNSAPLNDSGDQIGPAAAALGYGKGSSVLAMLENEIGTETMIKCMSTWIRTNPSRHIGSWEDFEKVVDKVTGKDYTRFFDQWVRRPGYPAMSLSDVSWSNGSLSGKLTFQGDPYRIHTDLLMRMPDAADQYAQIDTTKLRDGNGYRFTVPCPHKPALISIDPWQKIMRIRKQDEYPPNIFDLLFDSKRFVDPAHKDFLKPLQRGDTLTSLPDDLSNVFVIGSPETTPEMKPLCDKVGFTVNGNKLTYRGTTVDLDHGGAIALVDLDNGNRCLIGLGKCDTRVDSGYARLCVFDETGRPLRLSTDPVTTGPLTYSFP